MRKKLEFNWELIHKSETHATYRAAVYSGWILLHHTLIGKQMIESMVFLPDKEHDWFVTNAPKEPLPESKL